jgi:hypothetical protein
MNLFGLARQAEGARVGRLAARHKERRIPERVPLILLKHVRRDFLDAVLSEAFLGLAVHAAAPGSNAVFRRDVGGERPPGTTFLPRRQLRYGRRAVVDGKPQAEFLITLAVPCQRRAVAVARLRGGAAP